MLKLPLLRQTRAVDLPYDYSVPLPRDPHAVGGTANGFFPPPSAARDWPAVLQP